MLIFGFCWLKFVKCGINYWIVKFGGKLMVSVFFLLCLSNLLVVLVNELKIFFMLRK